MDLRQKNILVTGGTGFVGSHLVEELVKQHARVVVTYQTLNPFSYFMTQGLHQYATLVPIDIADFDKVYDMITKFHIEYIFHLAAQPLVDVAYYNPRKTLQSNIMGTVNVLESARLFGKVKGIIVASSDKSYGKLPKGKYSYTETDALLGDHPYEVSKSSTDLISYCYYKTYGLPVVVTRFGNIYGEGDLNFSRIIPGIMESLISKETLAIRSNGKFVRDYLYVKDVVAGYMLLAQHVNDAAGEAYNFGSRDTLSVISLIEGIQKKLAKKIDYQILNQAKNEIPYQSLDYTKIEKSIGWQPEFSVETTIKKIFQWYERHFKTSIS